MMWRHRCRRTKHALIVLDLTSIRPFEEFKVEIGSWFKKGINANFAQDF